MRVLVVEDEADLNNVIVKKLCAEGYEARGCFSGREALALMEASLYGAVILDVMIPAPDGLEVVRQMRARGIATPVLFLTARDSVADRVAGLDSGANDYLTKPFSFDELLARIRAMTRNTGGSGSVLAAGGLKMDITGRTVSRDGNDIELSAREFSLLEYLLRNKNVVLSREKIENNVWDYGYEGGSNVVDVYIRYLRKKIDDPFEKKLIHTIRGSGYMLKDA